MQGEIFREDLCRKIILKNALLNPSLFPVTWELVPGRGAREAAQEKALAYARQAAEGEKISALTVTDNPGGTPAMSADFMGGEIREAGHRTACPFYL